MRLEEPAVARGEHDRLGDVVPVRASQPRRRHRSQLERFLVPRRIGNLIPRPRHLIFRVVPVGGARTRRLARRRVPQLHRPHLRRVQRARRGRQRERLEVPVVLILGHEPGASIRRVSHRSSPFPLGDEPAADGP